MIGVPKVSEIMRVLLVCLLPLFANIASPATDPARHALFRFADLILANQWPEGAVSNGRS